VAVILSFDGGTAGAAIPTSATIQEVSGAQYTATAQHGDTAMETTGNNEFIRVDFTNGSEHSGSMYFRSGIVATSRLRIVTIATASNSVVGGIGLNPSGKIDLFDSLVRATSTVDWTPSTWHRIDWQFVSATKTLTVRIFLTPEATVHDDEISHSFAAVTTPAKWMFGSVSSGPGAALQIDTISAVTGLSWIGPFAAGGFAWSEWNGTTEVPLTLEGEWNGVTVTPANTDSVT
jgi:hypothetical protein